MNPKTAIDNWRRRYAFMLPISVVFLVLSAGMLFFRPRNLVAWLNVITWTSILVSMLLGRRAMRLIASAERQNREPPSTT